MEIGKMIVLINLKTKKEIVMYITKEFPFKEICNAIQREIFKIRTPTNEEMEFCYWCYETTNSHGCDLDGIKHWKLSKNKV
jgi:hypothetical protein